MSREVHVRFCERRRVRFPPPTLLVVLCQSQREAKHALAEVARILAGLGLEPKAAKTRIVHLAEGGEGLDFLGFHHRWVRAASPRHRHVLFLARWPTKQAMLHVRNRIRELTDRSRKRLPVEVVVAEVNRVLRGWGGFFRFGNSARHFSAITSYARMRMALLVAKRHKRSRAFGWWVVAFASPDYLGLVDLDGTVVAPRPFRSWRGRLNAGGERRR